MVACYSSVACVFRQKMRKFQSRHVKPIFRFQSPKEEYRCDAVVMACFDHRFDLVLLEFLKGIGIVNPDLIIIAGGARSLASPEHDTDREFVLDQIEKSIGLHGTDRAILMLHSDCGAYGGLEKFNGNEAEEFAHHSAELMRARAILQGAFPSLAVECCFIDFAGVRQLDPIPLRTSAETRD